MKSRSNGHQNIIQSRDRARERFLRLYDTSGLSLTKFAQAHGLSPGTMSRFLHDPSYNPKRPDIRAALGLTIRYEIDGKVCQTCGDPFPPNTPYRKNCYKCRPVRSTRKETQ